MKKFIAILSVLFSAISLYANQAAATVLSFDEAELTGDITDWMWVDFLNENHSKGQVTAGKTAELSWFGWPKCTITKLTVWVKSNKSGGAGSLSVSIGDAQIQIADGNFSSWPGQDAYSTEYVPVAVQGAWNMRKNQTLNLILSATANSIYFDRLEVEYTPAVPEAYSVTLMHFTDTGLHQSVIYESDVASGVVLPSVPDIDTWTFEGWASRKINMTDTLPVVYQADSRYFPEDNETLWAVFRQGTVLYRIAQDTMLQSGDYAMAVCIGNDWYRPHGTVDNAWLELRRCRVEMTEDSLYSLMVEYLPASARYHLDVCHDSVYIKHVQSGNWIGWSSNHLAVSKRLWNTARANNHSICFYHNRETDDDARALWTFWPDNAESFVLMDVLISLPLLEEAMILFEVSDIPIESDNLWWSSDPFGVDALEDMERQYDDTCKIIHNGQLIVTHHGDHYTVLGTKL